jgi:hypothetical protein
MTGQPTLLAVLLEDKGLNRYGSFRAAYEKAARSLDRQRCGTPPSRAQFHRWLTGDLRGLPHVDHCLVLEHLVTGYTAGQLFQPCPDRPASLLAHAGTAAADDMSLPLTAGTAELVAAFANRSDFTAAVQPHALLASATRIRAAGLSLNMICQQVPDQELHRMLMSGAHLTCLFLDPAGEAMKAREREEEHPPGYLATFTTLNIQVMTRLRDRLPAEARDQLRLAVYDETIRFNLILVDDVTCVVQPYLPRARGIDSPTLLLRRNGTPSGLYPVFEQVYAAIEDRSTPL